MASPRSLQFFKVFLPELCSDRLKIPPLFPKHIKAGRSPDTVSLQGPGGSIWHANLVMYSGELFFEDGWKEFAHDHSLQSGDFLVFRYAGNLQFNVLVFDGTACEKAEAFLARPSQDDDVMVLDRAGKDGDNTGEEASRALVESRNGSVRVTPKRKRGRPCKNMGSDEKKKRGRPRKNTGSDDCTLLERHVVKNLSFCEEDYSPGSMILPLDASMPSKFAETHSPSVAEASSLSRTTTPPSSSSKKLNKSIKTNTSMLPCRVPSSMKSGQLCGTEDASKRGSYKSKSGYLSQRRPVTTKELDKALEKANTFKSKHPFFKVIMTDSYVYWGFFMNVPCDFPRKHLPKDDRKLILWDPNGESWDVKFLSYGSRGGISAGWCKFAVRNNLERGDVCVFEVIKKYHMRVHIFRVVKKITPLLPVSEA